MNFKKGYEHERLVSNSSRDNGRKGGRPTSRRVMRNGHIILLGPDDPEHGPAGIAICETCGKTGIWSRHLRKGKSTLEITVKHE